MNLKSELQQIVRDYEKNLELKIEQDAKLIFNKYKDTIIQECKSRALKGGTWYTFTAGVTNSTAEVLAKIIAEEFGVYTSHKNAEVYISWNN